MRIKLNLLALASSLAAIAPLWAAQPASGTPAAVRVSAQESACQPDLRAAKREAVREAGRILRQHGAGRKR